MVTTAKYLTREEIQGYIKVKGYYELADVLMAFEQGNFSEYPFTFLMYILHVLAPEMGRTEYGEQFRDLTVTSLYDEFDKEDFYKKLEEYVPVITKAIAEESIRLTKTGGLYADVSMFAMKSMRNMRVMIYRNYIGRDNPSGKMNQVLRTFNHIYKKGLTTPFGEDEKALTEQLLTLYYDQDYDDACSPTYDLPQ